MALYSLNASMSFIQRLRDLISQIDANMAHGTDALYAQYLMCTHIVFFLQNMKMTACLLIFYMF